MNFKIAIIGSFKKHFQEVQAAIKVFLDSDIVITTPIGSSIIDPGINFIRFKEDLVDESDEMVQTITLKRIFEAGVVYTVAPTGYVGRTTCYEIGRVIQKKIPIYFSSHPNDLPVKIPETHILAPEQMANVVLNNEAVWPFYQQECESSKLENEILEIPLYGNKET